MTDRARIEETPKDSKVFEEIAGITRNGRKRFEITGLTPTPRFVRIGPKRKNDVSRTINVEHIDYRRLRHPSHLLELVWIQYVDMENHENERMKQKPGPLLGNNKETDRR